jgi:hypothetical protein
MDCKNLSKDSTTIKMLPKYTSNVSGMCMKHPDLISSTPIVEGASEVVDSISNHEGEIIENGDIIKSMYQSLCTILRVNLNDSGISLMKRKDASFDVANVYIGPINLQA